MGFFRVQNKDSPDLYLVFAIHREEEKDGAFLLQGIGIRTEFLIYKDDTWHWVPARGYIPIDVMKE